MLLFRTNFTTGQSAAAADVFPDVSAPVVRNGGDGVRELTMASRGRPSPKFALEGKKTDPGVTNIRRTNSPHWRRWLGPLPLRRAADVVLRIRLRRR